MSQMRRAEYPSLTWSSNVVISNLENRQSSETSNSIFKKQCSPGKKMILLP